MQLFHFPLDWIELDAREPDSGGDFAILFRIRRPRSRAYASR
jgi:hypothetical protein